MLATSSSLNSANIAFYDRSGQALALFRSEPVQRVVPTSPTTGSEEQTTGDTVSLSPEGIEKSRQQNNASPAEQSETSSESSPKETSEEQSTANSQALTPEEEQMVQDLKQRDQEVKTHEMAHLAAAGQYATGGPSYTYQQGPDGRRYAVGGEVPIDVSEEKTPEETIQKMQAIKRAAMAPAEPSSTDRSVAASAAATESRARQQLQAEEMNPSQEQSATDTGAAAESDSSAAPQPSAEEPAISSVDVIA
nr:putative metalloprotease CJM1_0395 family protein [uncultured Desulfobulbus sp.]